jgi:signal transduction histidine kinase
VDDRPATASRIGTVAARSLVGLVCVVATASLVVTWVLIGPVRALDLPGVGGSVQPTDVAEPLLALALVTLGALVILRGRSHRYGWLLLTVGVVAGVVQAAGEYSLYALYGAPEAGLPLAVAAGWVQDLWMVWFLFGILLLPALFPDGRTVGRWRWPVRVVAAGWVALIVGFMLADRPLTNMFLELPRPPANPTGVLLVPEVALDVLWLVLTAAAVVVGAGSVVTRWRTATSEVRQQLKWVLYAFGVVAAVVAANLVTTVLVEVAGADLGLEWPLGVLTSLAWVGVVVALGLGVLRYRLYDVDLIINRTLVYGIMTALVLLAYVAVVAGVAALLPAVEEFGLSLLATALVAVAFDPMRGRVQQAVNRLMFGRRDDPYAVLSDLGRLLARSGAPDATLGLVAETVAAALKVRGVAVELDHDGVWERRAVAGTLSDDVEVVPLRHQGEVVGRMVVARRSPGEPLHSDDHRLLENVAHHAAAVAHGLRLTVALQRSREQLVLAREEERRRLRRDLHDELGPSLASQTFRLDAILEMLDRDPAAAARLAVSLKQQNAQLVADIRRLVYELRPPALDELGLFGALAAHAGQLAGTGELVVDMVTDPDPLGDLPAAVEVAAYRIACEAVTNVVRHAQASTCSVALELAHASLTIRVCDDGVGVPSATRPGIGMTSMRERAEELGGTLHVARTDTGGARVTALLPIAVPAQQAVVDRAAVLSAPPLPGPVPSMGGRDG